MGKLICPHCDNFTAPIPFVFKAKIRFKQQRLAPLIPTYPYMEGAAEAMTPYKLGQPTYGVIVCQSCGKHFIAEKKAGDWLAVYPIEHKPVAEDIPEPIHSELEEANLCFAIGAYKACIAMCMTALEALWQKQNASGLNDLRDKGIISQRLFDQAEEIRRWAGVVKHELIHETVTKDEAEELLTYLEEILHDVYVRPPHLAALAEKRKQIKKSTKSKIPPPSTQ